MKTTLIQPYLYFGGNCEEAMEFYRTALGAKIQFVMRFNESPEPAPPGMVPPGFENKIMHATLLVGDAVLMMSDGCDKKIQFQGFSLSLSFSTAEEVDRAFNALSQGGQVKMPPTKTFWSPRFGMVTDRFGVDWMVTVAIDAKP